MEYVIELAAEYSGAIAPGLAVWATLLLHMQPKDKCCSVSQVWYFVSLLFVSVLTVRATMSHDPMWLANAASLGVLIVSGVLKRPVDEMDSLVLNSRV